MAVVTADERLKQTSFLTRLMRRPELGALAGVLLVGTLLLDRRQRPDVHALGHPHLHVAGGPARHPRHRCCALDDRRRVRPLGRLDGGLLGLIFGTAVTVLQLPLLLAILLTFLLAGCFGALNGQIVLRTGLPSFIVTLAFLFIFAG
jgi:simple sugar transport system permease protein